MYNLNVSGPPLLGVDGVCTNQTPRTPEILNSLIAMTNPLEYSFPSNQQKITQYDSHSSCSESPLDSPAGSNVPPSVQQHMSGMAEGAIRKVRKRTVRAHQETNGQFSIHLEFSASFGRLHSYLVLTIIDCKVSDHSFISNMGRKMLALKSIHIDDVRIIKFNKDNERVYHLCNVDGIIKQNGHVKNFRSLTYKWLGRLRNMSKAMTRLDTLELQIQKAHFKLSNFTSINFKWISFKSLVGGISGCGWIQCPLVFDVLEELDITIEAFGEEWLFFASSNNLKKLRLATPHFIYDIDQLLTISAMWPNLIEASLNLDFRSVHETIEFIDSFRNWERFNVLRSAGRWYSYELNIIEFKRSLSDDYKVLRGTYKDRFSLVRLNVILSSLDETTDQLERLWSRDSGFNDNLPLRSYIHPFRSFAPTDAFVMAFNVNDSARFSPLGSEFYVSVHAPDELPLFGRYTKTVSIVPGNDNYITLTPQLIVSEGIEHYAPEVRQCYYSDERYLRFYRNYTLHNCEKECIVNYTLARCGCVPYQLPHFGDTKLCTTEFPCYMREATEILLPNFVDDAGHAPIDKCNCLPPCTQLSYEPVRTKTLERDASDYTSVHIQMKGPHITKHVRTELHSISEFFSNCGGSLGLFLGVSIFSVVELLYFCTVRLYLHNKKRITDSTG